MRADQHLPTPLLMEELALKQAELRIACQIASMLSYNLICAKVDYFTSSQTEGYSKYFTRLDMRDVVGAAFQDSPKLEALNDRIRAVEWELQEREFDRQDEVAA